MARRVEKSDRRSHPAPRASRKGAPARGLPGGVRIVHEDDDLIVVDKPAGLLTAGLPGQEIEGVFRYIKVRVRKQRKRRGTQGWIIHPLEKEALGAMGLKKTQGPKSFFKE